MLVNAKTGWEAHFVRRYFFGMRLECRYGFLIHHRSPRIVCVRIRLLENFQFVRYVLVHVRRQRRGRLSAHPTTFLRREKEMYEPK